MIRVQEQPFDAGAELAALRKGRIDIGGFALFVGSVRDLSEGKLVSALTLEHYPGMTESALSEIEAEARSRWPLQETLVVHRYGRMEPGEDIVLVIAASAHREAAFEACAFIMDRLKTNAPFWKLEEGSSGKHWVESKTSDDLAAARWRKQQ